MRHRNIVKKKIEQKWLKRRQKGSCIACKKGGLVYVCVEPVFCKICLECLHKNVGPCFASGKVVGKHRWMSTLGPKGAGSGQAKGLPKHIFKNAWFYCLRCPQTLV